MDYKQIKKNGEFEVNGRRYILTKCNFVESRAIFDDISILEKFGKGLSITSSQEFKKLEKNIFKHILTEDNFIVNNDHFEEFPEDYLEVLTIGGMALVSPFLPKNTD